VSDATPDCKEPGLLAPVIDRDRCEGKADCVRVCPYDVFVIDTLGQTERRALSLPGKIKAFVHRYRQAFVRDPSLCHACGACVTACPESAITLRRPEAAQWP
jgi:4Fe-4S ferredoxin